MEFTRLVFQGDLEAVRRRILDDPTAVNRPQPPGWTPLMAAVESGNADMVRLLLRHGADPDDNAGQPLSPLLQAIELLDECEDHEPGDIPAVLECIRALLEFQADLGATDSQGKDAVAFARGRSRAAYDLLREPAWRADSGNS